MRRLLIYKDKQVYVVDDKISIIPSGIEPEEEYDLSDLTNDEYMKLIKNPEDKRLLKKAKLIKRKE